MRFKVLIVPFMIVMMLILLIGFIKPDMDVMQTKKADILTKKDLVSKMDTVLTNINTLNGSLDSQADIEKFTYRYLPSDQNQERVIDAFNFLATQLGVVITKMELKQSPVRPTEEVIVDASGMPITTPAPLAAKTFIFSGSVKGSYENIKVFFDRLNHIERFQNISLFSIETNTTGTDQTSDTNQLVGTFETEFGYLLPKSSVSALDIPIFSHSKFNFTNVNTLLGQTGDSIPPLEKGSSGRPNPFQ